MSRSDIELLREARLHLEHAQRYGEERNLDQLSIDAICMRLSAGIEVLARLDPELRSELFEDDWAAMWGMRNRIAHGYLLVSNAIVVRTIEHDLPMMTSAIDRGLATEGKRA